MPMRYKIDVLNALKEKGYNTNKIRTEGLLSQSTLQKFRNQQGVSWENLETLCRLLECQPGDLIEFVDSFADPMVGICWDTGHANQNGFDQYRALTAVEHRLKALHLHDNHYGNKDEHLLPYMGEVKWEDVIRALVDIGYEGTMNYESAKACTRANGEAQMQLIRLSYANACYLRDLYEQELAK